MRYLGKRPVEQEIEVITTLLAGSLGQWVDWTPNVTQLGSVGVTVTEAKYTIIGKVCHIYAYLAVTGSGTTGNDIVIAGLPTAAQPARTGDFVVGTAEIVDTSASAYFGFVEAVAANDLRVYDSATRAVIGTNPNFALANTDTIGFSATYRVA